MVEYLAFIFITISFLFLIIKNKHFKLDDISRIYILLSYLLKIGSGIALWYIYTYHYSDTRVNDIHKYFNDGKQLAAIFKNNLSDFLSVIKGSKINNVENLKLLNEMQFWEKPNSYGIYNDNQTIIIVSSILNLLTNNHLLLAILYMSTLSFIAIFTIYKTLSPYLEFKKTFYLLLFITPSIALWTTGLLKENLILLALTIIIYFTAKLLIKRKTIYFIGYILGLITLMFTKPYLIGFILPSVLCFVLYNYFKVLHIKKLFFSIYTLFFMCFLIWIYTHNPVIYNYKNKSESEKSKEYDRVNQISYQKNVLGNNYNILEMLRFKQADYNHEAKLAKAKSLVNTKKMNGELSNFFACIPYGISNGFARPHIFEIHSITYILPALENIFILTLILLIFIFPRKLNINQQILIFYLGTFIVITFTFLGLLVPVLGNLVRYKAPLLPLLLFSLLALIDRSKITKFIFKNSQLFKPQLQK